MNQEKDYAIARELAAQIAACPGAVDVHLAQVHEWQPELRIDVDRTEASQQGSPSATSPTTRSISLSSSGQVAPSFWLDATKGVQYPIAIQTPQYRMDTLDALRETPMQSARRRGAADTRQPGVAPARSDGRQHHALQRPADVRRAGQRPGRRPGIGVGRRR